MLSDETLAQLRQDIDHLDIDLINLLSKRMQLCNQVGRHKVETNAPTRDLDREKSLIEKKVELAKSLGLSPHFVHQVFDLIIEQSVKQQYQMKVNIPKTEKSRVAFLGELGSYSHQALLQHFSTQQMSISPIGYPSFRKIVEAVKCGEMEMGILPLENTTTGAILEVYDLLQGSGVHIVGEEILSVKHCLVGKDGDLSSINKVFGHPQAIAQCNDLLLNNPDWHIEYCSSSAAAIEKVLKASEPGTVAIANEFAANLYKLEVIHQNSSNQRKNFTRFILLSKEAMEIPVEVPCKTSILFATHQEAGSLVSVLNQFKSNGIVLTKLQSRPVPEKPWEEMFYVDIEGHIKEGRVQNALKSADPYCQFLKLLGCYPNSQLEKAKVEIN